MDRVKRRSYLKGALATTGVLIGVSGAASSLPIQESEHDPNGPSEDDEEEDDEKGGKEEKGGKDGKETKKGGKNQCEPPNELLAKFEWVEDDEEFVFEKPDEHEGLVEFTDVETDEDNEPTGFCWKSEVPICAISTKLGQSIESVQGDVRSGCVDLSDEDHAISNVIFCVRPAQAVLCDVQLDGFGVEMGLDGDPANDGVRDGVVHVTSPDGATSDYASGTVNVAFEQPDLTVGDFDNGHELLYDFFEGPDNSNAMPDEAFLILQTPDQYDNVQTSLDDGNTPDDQFDVAYLTSFVDREQDNWWTRAVDSEMNGDFPGDVLVNHSWKTNTISSGSILTASGIIQTAAALRDSAPAFDDLVDAYDPDTRVLGVGFGYGHTQEEVELDGYFDSLAIDGTHYDFPLAVPLRIVNTDANGTTTITMALDGQEGVSVSDVVESSVRLIDPVPVAPTPPTTQQGGTFASDVSVDEGAGEITATFETSHSGDFLVSGDFDISRDQIVSFYAEGGI